MFCIFILDKMCIFICASLIIAYGHGIGDAAGGAGFCRGRIGRGSSRRRDREDGWEQTRKTPGRADRCGDERRERAQDLPRRRGLWEEYDVMEVASIEGWHRNPKLMTELVFCGGYVYQ